MKAIEPVRVTGAMLISSTLPEADHPEWNAGVTYGLGAVVIKAASHRIYESLTPANLGNDPASAASSQWMDIGPTNRWGMFEEALGSTSFATGSLSVTIAPGAVDTLAVVQAKAATIRVEVKHGAVSVYDQTTAAKDTTVFEELPANPTAQIIITLSGAGTVSAGVIVPGIMLALGKTEAGPGIGINDFSTRSTDDYGVTTVVARGWAKTVTCRSLIATDDIDSVQSRVAALRARPTLWIADDGWQSLIVYGFFKSFGIDVAAVTVSLCSFTIEGLAA